MEFYGLCICWGLFFLVTLYSLCDWRPAPDLARAAWRFSEMANGAPSWTTFGTELQPVLCAENLASVLPKMPCREPSWVKVSKKSFHQLTLEIQEKLHRARYLWSLSMFIVHHALPEKTGGLLQCFAYLSLILDAAPVCPGWSDNVWACVFVCLSVFVTIWTCKWVDCSIFTSYYMTLAPRLVAVHTLSYTHTHTRGFKWLL